MKKPKIRQDFGNAWNRPHLCKISRHPQWLVFYLWLSANVSALYAWVFYNYNVSFKNIWFHSLQFSWIYSSASLFQLTFCGLVTPYGVWDLGKKCFRCGLLPRGTKPLPEQCWFTINVGLIHSRVIFLNTQDINPILCLNFTYLKSQQHPQGVNGLNCIAQSVSKSAREWTNGNPAYIFCIITGVILCMRPNNERRRYNVTSSLIDWAHVQKDPCIMLGLFRKIVIYDPVQIENVSLQTN